jgi:hypothetical protein
MEKKATATRVVPVPRVPFDRVWVVDVVSTGESKGEETEKRQRGDEGDN